MLDVPAILSALFVLLLVLSAVVSLARIAAETKKIRELLERRLREPGEP